MVKPQSIADANITRATARLASIEYEYHGTIRLIRVQVFVPSLSIDASRRGETMARDRVRDPGTLIVPEILSSWDVVGNERVPRALYCTDLCNCLLAETIWNSL